MKHAFKNGFHTARPCKHIAPPAFLVERNMRTLRTTGLVIAFDSLNTALQRSSDLFFDGPHKDLDYEAVSASQFARMRHG